VLTAVMAISARAAARSSSSRTRWADVERIADRVVMIDAGRITMEADLEDVSARAPRRRDARPGTGAWTPPGSPE